MERLSGQDCSGRAWGLKVPVYRYRCERCGIEHEVQRPMSAFVSGGDCLDSDCTGKVYVVVQPPAGVHFRGSGFYETDYKRKKGAAR